MSAQKRGVQYENDVTNAVNEYTDTNIQAYRAGWADQPDIVITGHHWNHVIELKRSAQDRFYIDREQLKFLTSYRNVNTSSYIVMKFTHREPIVINIRRSGEDFTLQVPDGVETYWTDAGNLAITKPSTSTFPSASAGRADHVAIVEELGL